jgi:hypothetical protein
MRDESAALPAPAPGSCGSTTPRATCRCRFADGLSPFTPNDASVEKATAADKLINGCLANDCQKGLRVNVCWPVLCDAAWRTGDSASIFSSIITSAIGAHGEAAVWFVLGACSWLLFECSVSAG